MVSDALFGVSSTIIYIIIGYILGGANFFKEHEGGLVFTGFLNWVVLPCYLFYSVFTNFDTSKEIIDVIKHLPIPLGVTLLNILIGYFCAMLFKIQIERRGVFINAIGFTNIIFVGLPLITTVFGESAIPTGMIYYMANMCLFWTIGISLLSASGSQRHRVFSLKTIKHVCSPPFIAFLIGIVAVLVGIKQLPRLIDVTISKISGICAPLGLMFIGTVVREADFKEKGYLRDLIVLFLARFILIPIALGLLYKVLPVDVSMKSVLYILSLMPAMTQLGIMSRQLDNDYRFASVWITVSYVFGLATIPLYVMLVDNIFSL